MGPIIGTAIDWRGTVVRDQYRVRSMRSCYLGLRIQHIYRIVTVDGRYMSGKLGNKF